MLVAGGVAAAQSQCASVDLPNAPAVSSTVASRSAVDSTVASDDPAAANGAQATSSQNSSSNPQDSSSSSQDNSSNPQDVAQPDLKPNQKTTVVGAPLPPAHTDNQPKRILGIIPNFRTVSADTKLPPQDAGDKFITASEDTFDYSALTFAGLVALEAYEQSATPEFGSGGVGFGRYMWHTYVDQSIENYFVEFIVPSAMHEDTRYYTLGHGGFAKRLGYSLEHVVVTRNDSGRQVFNTGEVVGAGMAAGISNLYYPTPERTLSNTGQKWGVNVGLDALTFAFKEFWPDINHKIFHEK